MVLLTHNIYTENHRRHSFVFNHLLGKRKVIFTSIDGTILNVISILTQILKVNRER